MITAMGFMMMKIMIIFKHKIILLRLPHIGVIIIMLSFQSPSSRDTRDDSMMRKNGYEKTNEEKEDSQSKVMLL